MWISLALIIIGLVVLTKGADWLVDGASSLAKRFGIAPLVIGLTVVAFGTSTPELVVNIISSFQGNTEIAIGNIVGSNIANMLLILGITATISPLVVKKNTTWKEIPFALLASVLIFIMGNDALIANGKSISMIDRIDGIIYLSFFAIFIVYILALVKQGSMEIEEDIKQMPLGKSILYIILGLFFLAAGGKLAVDNAVTFAVMLGISQSLVGLTIVAVGTSLPELATSAVAAYKKQTDIAVGNIVGSNIFNVFWILGISSVIKPLPFNPTTNVDVLVSIGATFLLFLTMFIGKKHSLSRGQGISFFILYILYIVYIVWRG